MSGQQLLDAAVDRASVIMSRDEDGDQVEIDRWFRRSNDDIHPLLLVQHGQHDKCNEQLMAAVA